MALPFDSYSPLTADVRGKYVGGYCTLPKRQYYGCCACIGGAGAGIVPQMALLRREDGFLLNFYAKGSFQTETPGGNCLTLTTDTRYPIDGTVKITVSLSSPEAFVLSLRIPAWCGKAAVTVNGAAWKVTPKETVIGRTWQAGDVVELRMEMPVVRILPPEGAVNAEKFAAYRRGPIVLAADRRIADPDAVFAIRCENGEAVGARMVECPEIRDCMECFELTCADGSTVRLIDYASAGKTWTEESRCAAWLRLV